MNYKNHKLWHISYKFKVDYPNGECKRYENSQPVLAVTELEAIQDMRDMLTEQGDNIEILWVRSNGEVTDENKTSIFGKIDEPDK